MRLLDFVGCVEGAIGKMPEKRLLPLQKGTVPETHANTDVLSE